MEHGSQYTKCYVDRLLDGTTGLGTPAPAANRSTARVLPFLLSHLARSQYTKKSEDGCYKQPKNQGAESNEGGLCSAGLPASPHSALHTRVWSRQ